MGDFFQYLMEIIRVCWSWIAYLSPFKIIIVDKGELAARKTFGKPGPNLDVNGKWGGIYAATSFQEFIKVQALGCKIDLEPLDLPLKDKVPVTIEAAMTYDVMSCGDWMCNSEDAEWLMSEIQEAELREALMACDYESLVEDFKKMEERAKSEAQHRIDEMKLGGKIKYLRIKKLVVVNNTAQTALCLEKITKALRNVPTELMEQKNLNALVAMVAGATPTNPMVPNDEE